MKHEIEIPEGMEFDSDNSVIKFKPLSPKQTPEELFLSMWEGCTVKIDKEKYPDSIFFFKGDQWMFEIENSILWCRYDKVWGRLSDINGLDYKDTQSFIRNLMEKHFKMKGVTPYGLGGFVGGWMEKHFKMKGVTPENNNQ
jgi:hypothetical protein